MQLRTYNIAPLFLGTDGLTDSQAAELSKLQQRHADFLTEEDPKKRAKLKLTEKMEAEYDRLVNIVHNLSEGKIELSQGAKTLIREYVDEELYGYKPTFSSKETEKGNEVEDDSIDLYNRLFFKDHKKQKPGDKYYELKHGIIVGHPDVVCDLEKKVKDAKSAWNKKTFPKLPEDAYNATHVWQVKTYLYMLKMMTGEEWRHGEVFYALADTPEGLVPEWEDDSLHVMSNVPLNMRLTVVDVELTDADIEHMERRINAAMKFAAEYKEQLLNKNR
jgi:hypothetical protein